MNPRRETMGQTDLRNRPEHTRSGTFYRPEVDILEKEDELLIVADLPGCSPDQIDIRFEDGELSIYARVEPRQKEPVHYLLREYTVGDYFRSFRISEAIDPSKISAEYAHGVLTVHLPKAEEVKPRKIPVKGA